MKRLKPHMIYIYKKGNERFAYLNPLTTMDMAMNNMEYSHEIDQNEGFEWLSKVNANIDDEELKEILGHSDSMKTTELRNYFASSMSELDNRAYTWFVDIIIRLTKKDKAALVFEESFLLEQALNSLFLTIEMFRNDVYLDENDKICYEASSDDIL